MMELAAIAAHNLATPAFATSSHSCISLRNRGASNPWTRILRSSSNAPLQFWTPTLILMAHAAVPGVGLPWLTPASWWPMPARPLRPSTLAPSVKPTSRPLALRKRTLTPYRSGLEKKPVVSWGGCPSTPYRDRVVLHLHLTQIIVACNALRFFRLGSGFLHQLLGLPIEAPFSGLGLDVALEFSEENYDRVIRSPKTMLLLAAMSMMLSSSLLAVATCCLRAMLKVVCNDVCGIKTVFKEYFRC